MEEIWKDVIGYEGFYKISNIGNYKSLDREVTRKDGFIVKIKGRSKLFISTDKLGYKRAGLSIKNHKVHHSLHRLVAKHFIPNPNDLEEVNHKDGDKANNYAGNLEWISRSGNIKHSYDSNLRQGRKGEKHHNATFKDNTIRELRKDRLLGMTYSQIGLKYNTTKATAFDICKRRSWLHID